MVFLRVAIMGLALLISGCAITPKNMAGCNFVRRELAVSDPNDRGQPTLAADMSQSLNRHRAFLPPQERLGSMLFLSGGGQNGAFGAGFLQGWKNKHGGRLPEFTVVTGISTGAILSTFAFINQPERALAGYTITDERVLLTAFSKRGGTSLGLSTGFTLLRKGAVADLEPLRSRLDTALSDDVLEAVATAADRGRKLFVGAIDLDTGEAVAFDLTDMAVKWKGAEAGAERERLEACYIEAIVASSSAPIAATPVFINHRMYMDGGARFGVFSDEIGKVLEERSVSGGLAGPPPTTYVLINGDQLIGTDCGTQADCGGDNPAPGDLARLGHKKWNFLDLALRSEEILVNQVYRFSADSIRASAEQEGTPFKFVKISPEVLDFKLDLTGSGLDDGERTCRDWRQRDRDLSKPLQFHPRYMRCLIAYGQAKAASSDW
ncbi:patatin-like phospholipase family protein [Sphingobium yanoikuyae]|jgi:hypothetical protein|uniref:patatin-like phospholipase family protein n=1 Tax=Sphingobium yanoikuyae TaxID=13690 RepID=UPI00241C0E7F|nr:patatin-like phospholipase family protein [Sphingobium yanoikuyae]HEV7437078.1 patatin-like phospholipase family protein [Pseudorhizobium sp.]